MNDETRRMGRLFSEHCPVVHCAPRRVRVSWGRRMLHVLLLLAVAALCGWLLTGCERAAAGNEAMTNEQVGMLLVLAASVLAIIRLAVRKQAENEAFFRRLREDRQTVECDEFGEPIWPTREEIDRRASAAVRADETNGKDVLDVFQPLRAPGEPVPAEDVRRILVACAAEGRCIMKHVRRAQTTLSVEDYAGELRLAERKLAAVVRCVEALVRRQSDAETVRLGDIEQCEREGGAL